MSDIRYNSWLHRSGTGGVYQDSSGRIGIGTSVPAGTGLHVKEGYSGLSAPNAHADTLYLENSGNAGITIATPNTNTGYLTFADPDDDNIGQIIYRHNGNSMGFFVNAAERLRIDTNGSLMVGNTAAASMFSVANNLVVGSGSGSEGMTIYSDSTNDGYIVFADGASDPAYRMGQIIYSHNSNNMQFRTNGNTNRLVINADGNSTFTGIVTATDFIADSQITHKNMVDNGGMVIAQRDQAASGSSTTAWVPTCDRFVFVATNTDNASFDFSQEPINQAVPGLSRYLKVTPNTAESALANNEYFTMYTTLEAQQLQRLKWGTSSAETCTLSFWVKSSATGTFCVNFYKMDATGYMTTRTYTVDAADTWERKTITIPGLTSSGIANDTGNGLRIHWILAAGSDYTSTNSGSSWVGATNAAFAYGHNINMIDNTNDNWNITGIQFEIGSEATPFEVLPYTIDLQRCMRYYQQFGGSGTTLGRLPMVGECTSTTVAQYPLKFSVPMRGTTAPTLVVGTASNYKVYSGNATTDCSSLAIAAGFKNQEPYGDIWGIRLNMNVASGLSAGHAAQAYNSTSGDVLGFDAEFPA